MTSHDLTVSIRSPPASAAARASCTNFKDLLKKRPPVFQKDKTERHRKPKKKSMTGNRITPIKFDFRTRKTTGINPIKTATKNKTNP